MRIENRRAEGEASEARQVVSEHGTPGPNRPCHCRTFASSSSSFPSPRLPPPSPPSISSISHYVPPKAPSRPAPKSRTEDSRIAHTFRLKNNDARMSCQPSTTSPNTPPVPFAWTGAGKKLLGAMDYCWWRGLRLSEKSGKVTRRREGQFE